MAAEHALYAHCGVRFLDLIRQIRVQTGPSFGSAGLCTKRWALLCATSVSSVSPWLMNPSKYHATETQRTQRLHRELPEQSRSAEKINQSNDGDCQQDYGGNKTEPDEPVDHVFGFHIHRAPRTATSALLEHVATISTGFRGHRSNASELLPASIYTTLLVQELTLA
jgi:hypothetical protein